MHTTQNIKTLSDSSLLLKLKALSNTENETTAQVLLHLAEVDARKLYVPLGYSSLFSYCISVLRYSEPAANRRICSARALARFPKLLPLLLGREISLSGLASAASILSKDNLDTVLSGIRGKSYREIQKFVVQYRPRTIIREEIKPVALKVRQSTPAVSPEMPLFERRSEVEVSPLTQAPVQKELSVPAASSPHLPLESVLEERYEVRFSIRKEVMKKLEEAKVLLSGKYPKGVKLEDLLDEALEALLDKRSPERREKRREERRVSCSPSSQDASVNPEAPVARPPLQSVEKASRHLPIKLRDAVWLRDGGCCGFVGKDGKRCDERHGLEVHHILPFAVSPGHELSNITLRCRAHNLHEALLDFGRERMGSFMTLPSAPSIE